MIGSNKLRLKKKIPKIPHKNMKFLLNKKVKNVVEEKQTNLVTLEGMSPLMKDCSLAMCGLIGLSLFYKKC